MYTYEKRMKAVLLYIKYDKSPSAVIYELGYPSRNILASWYKEYVETGVLHGEDNKWKSKYSAEQRKTAITYYLEHGRSISRTVRALGYPKKTTLADWLNADLPGDKRKWHCKSNGAMVKCSIEQKKEAVTEYCSGKSKPAELAKKLGVSSNTIYKWRDSLLGKEREKAMPRKKTDKQIKSAAEPQETKTVEKLLTEISALEEKLTMLDKKNAELDKMLFQKQLEFDVLSKAAEILKKDRGISLEHLTNREKAIVIDALREKYSLKLLLSKLMMSKSSYFYQKTVIKKPDKYAIVRDKVKKIFDDSGMSYGYRRIYTGLKNEEIVISEKVIRKLMNDGSLCVLRAKSRKYSSYEGEISPEVDNIINRNFHADAPNEKWLTDITEFIIPAGKVYLSPIIDCFDGMPVTWTIGTSPNAELVNTMLDAAIQQLNCDEHPIVHSDRGSHYRWPGWIERMDNAGLTRSMSKKGCSPDNSACEGFFGRLKNEMFYYREWMGISIENFIDKVDEYMRWYCENRISMVLGGMSPFNYRMMLGLVV